jgi:integrase
LPNQPARGKKNLGELIEEWKREILPNRKLGGARASLSHIRTYITPLLGYLFLNLKGRLYPSVNVIKYEINRAMEKLGIQTAKGAHIGIHCFRHGVTTQLLESGTPIQVVTRMMRHGDSKVTLDHYAHVIGETERVASEKFSQRIGQNIAQLESDAELESASAVKTA